MSRASAFVRHSTCKLLMSACFAVALIGAALAWGAIAVDDSYQDNANCKAVLKFKACGALASLKQKFGVGEGPTKQAAEQVAMKACGQSACKVAASECEGT
jgi:hypothetical protein